MYKDHLLHSIEREIAQLKALIPHIEEKDLAFRPNEKVRSTYELMQYLSTIGSTMMHWYLDGMTQEYRDKAKANRESLTLANFGTRLDEQLKTIKQSMERVKEEDLHNKMVELPYKETMPLGQAIIAGPIRWLAVYRMELFVYLKLIGKTELSTKEAWTLAVPAASGN
jgi:hypothetical protein